MYSWSKWRDTPTNNSNDQSNFMEKDNEWKSYLIFRRITDCRYNNQQKNFLEFCNVNVVNTLHHVEFSWILVWLDDKKQMSVFSNFWPWGGRLSPPNCRIQKISLLLLLIKPLSIPLLVSLILSPISGTDCIQITL